MKVARSTPPAARKRFEQILSAIPAGHSDLPALQRLANDKRMKIVWDAVKGWPDDLIAALVVQACIFAFSRVTTDLLESHEDRVSFAAPHFELWAQMQGAADTLEKYREWAKGQIDATIANLRKISAAASADAEEARGFMADLPTTSRKGAPGPLVRAYRAALSTRLAHLSAKSPRPMKTQVQAEIVATLASVVFDLPRDRLDAETVVRRNRRDRQPTG